VVATLLATLLAIHFGQTVVVLIAVMLYALAAWQLPRRA
jgi:heme A synthase